MRVSRLLVPLVLVALAGPALAAGCVPSCEVTGALALFAPPTVVVDSGASVSWLALDVPHTATADDGSTCFNAPFTARTPGVASFRIVDGALLARVGITEKACTGAARLPDGAFVLPYECLYHRHMVGEVVVRPGVDA